MPSMQLIGAGAAVASGGQPLLSGGGLAFSGTGLPVGGVQLKLAAGAPGTCYVALTNLSGDFATILSGGTLSSGGLADGMEMAAGDSYFVPKVRLKPSGLDSVRVVAPAAASGGVMCWELF